MKIDEVCAFELIGRSKTCLALSKKQCDGCKFFKTREQAKRDVEHAAEILKNKGLEPYQKGVIMTTRPIKRHGGFQQIKNKWEDCDK